MFGKFHLILPNIGKPPAGRDGCAPAGPSPGRVREAVRPAAQKPFIRMTEEIAGTRTFTVASGW